MSEHCTAAACRTKHHRTDISHSASPRAFSCLRWKYVIIFHLSFHLGCASMSMTRSAMHSAGHVSGSKMTSLATDLMFESSFCTLCPLILFFFVHTLCLGSEKLFSPANCFGFEFLPRLVFKSRLRLDLENRLGPETLASASRS